MRWQQLGVQALLVFDPGESVMATLTRWLAKQQVRAGTFTAIGGLRQVTLKYFNTDTRQYEERSFEEQFEVLNMTGNVGLLDSRPFVHAHITVGDREYHTRGGHFGDGIVSPLLELAVTPLEGTLIRQPNAATGLTELHIESPTED